MLGGNDLIIQVIITLGIILVVGYLSGKLSHIIGLPRITGYLLAGLFLNPSLLSLIQKDTVEVLNIITPVILGMISCMIGGGLKKEALQQLGKEIAGITIFQGLMPFVLSFALIIFLGIYAVGFTDASFLKTYLPMALVIGAISISSAPAAIVAIIHECKAKGNVTTTVLAVLAITDVVTVIIFSLALGFAQTMANGSQNTKLYMIIAEPLLHILASIITGIVSGYLIVWMTRLIKTRFLILFTTIAAILIVTVLAEAAGLSSIILNMTAGFLVINKAGDETTFSTLAEIEDVPFLLFFVLNGMNIDFQAIGASLILTILVMFGRKTGKYLGASFGARIVNAPDELRKYPGMLLLPKAGLSLGLAFIAKEALPSFGIIILNAIILSTLINMLVTPPLAKYALAKAGENNR
ncbi:MAG TPA: cation:proton antiporter [Smithellaceae bacterium]|nr:cation:proton antiporter [Smithellaceae bacterium]